MKKLLLLLIIPLLSFGQQTYVPDDVFEQALIDAGLDDILDNYVLTSNINNIQTINFMGGTVFFDASYINLEGEITDLTGIKGFSLLQAFNFGGAGNLNYADFSGMFYLTVLDIESNYLTMLDVSNCVSLTGIDVANNYLNCIDVSGCISLENLDVSGNFLSQLDVSSCIIIDDVSADGNPFLDCVQVNENSYNVTNDTEEAIDCGYTENLECNYNVSIFENIHTKSLLKNIDILGRDTNSKGFNIEIYDDGSVDKKYIVNTK